MLRLWKPSPEPAKNDPVAMAMVRELQKKHKTSVEARASLNKLKELFAQWPEDRRRNLLTQVPDFWNVQEDKVAKLEYMERVVEAMARKTKRDLRNSRKIRSYRVRAPY